MALTKKQREKQVVKVFDAYESFYNAAEDLLREDDEASDWMILRTRQALDGGHAALRELRLRVEEDICEPESVEDGPRTLADYNTNLKEFFEGYTDREIERQYEEAVEWRNWETAELAADELFRRQREPVGY